MHCFNKTQTFNPYRGRLNAIWKMLILTLIATLCMAMEVWASEKESTPYILTGVVSNPLNQTKILSGADSHQKPHWTLLSQATANWLWMDIYQAKLYGTSKNVLKTKTIQGTGSSETSTLTDELLSPKTPLELELCYLKSIRADQIREAATQNLPNSLSETLKAEVNRLHQSYRNVEPSDCYQLRYTPQQGTSLFLNQQLIFNSRLPGFKAVYFGIWLGNNPISNTLKTALISPLEVKSP